MLLALLLAVLHPPPFGQWAVDDTGRVPLATLAAFNQRARALDATGQGQLGLAIVKTTHGQNPRQFATAIFNAWGIGHSGRNDGVLLFFALDDRKSEIVLGDGFPPAASSVTDGIMANDVVANMKRGSLDDAIVVSADALTGFVHHELASAPDPRQGHTHEPDEGDTPEQQKLTDLIEGDARLAERSPRGWTIDLGYPLTPDETAALDREGDALYAAGQSWLFVAPFHGRVLLPVLAAKLRRQLHRNDVWLISALMPDGRVAIDAPEEKTQLEGWSLAIARIENDASDQLHGDRGWAIAAVLQATQATATLIREGPPKPSLTELVDANSKPIAGGAGGLAFVGLLGGRAWLRRRTRWCKSCGNPRHRLSEETDDPHLNPGQQVEEQLGSVDYDVWWCGRCNDALVLRYGTFFTRYSTCADCNFKTMSSTSMTLVEATYEHGGTVEVTERCQNCPHVRTYNRYTSQLTRSDSSSWGSSSSSSDSSFGGGSSSGGGSSGSW